MIADYEIRRMLARYLSKSISLDQLEDWLVQRSWDMHLDSSGAAQALASAIELRLAEYSSEHLDESQLRAELLPFVTTYNAAVRFGEGSDMVVSSDAYNQSIKPRVFVVRGLADSPQVFFDIPHAAARA